MNKYLKIGFLFAFLLLFGINNVYAEDCDATELKRIKLNADNIEISYILKDNLVDENGEKIDGYYLVTFSDISEDYFFTEVNSETKERRIYVLKGQVDNGKYSVIVRNPGKYNYEIYSEKCKSKVRTIKATINKKNSYSSDPLCDGHENLDVCSEDYDSSGLTKDEFSKIIEDAEKKENQAIEEKNGKDNKNEEKDNKDNAFISFMKSYYLYFIGVLVVVAIVITYKVINKKRGMLE